MTETAAKRNLARCQDQFFAGHCEAHDLLEKIEDGSVNWATVGTLEHIVAQMREIVDNIDTIKR